MGARRKRLWIEAASVHAGPTDTDLATFRRDDLEHSFDVVVAVRRCLAGDGARRGITV